MKHLNTRVILFIFFILCFWITSTESFSQEARSIDGVGNNLANPDWGAAGVDLLQRTTLAFTDGKSRPSGISRPNPRAISNAIFAQNDLIPDPMALSDYAWVWGQFIDHDITLVGEDHSEQANILVPAGDPHFDPLGTGLVLIPMVRSVSNPSSGTSLDNPRTFTNEITSFIDASAIYGSDDYTASWLRTFSGGKLRTSAGNLLPFNTVSGEAGAPVDLLSPPMAMPFPNVEKWFISGDARANENPALTVMHTLFTREHNRQADLLANEHPDWGDEELYQHARRIVGGLMQAITYEEWLPSLGINLDAYSGYDPNVNPGILNVFSAAAYRYGHTVINTTLIRMDNGGKEMPEGNILLRDAFFNPPAIVEMGTIYPYLKGMATQVEQSFDCKMVDDLRNFLFGAPGSGGLDLASLNINRGRERGLADYNTIRQDIGLPPVSSFSDITSDASFKAVLSTVYPDINSIDPWVGFLAEDRMSNQTLFGESVQTIMEMQFRALRDGDRFYYENDPVLTDDEKRAIKDTRLVEIIERNSVARHLQDNVFLAQDHTVVGIGGFDKPELFLEASPNPATDRVYIKVDAPQSGLGKLTISNVAGQIILEEQHSLFPGENALRLNLEQIPTGLYNVRLDINGKFGTQKLIIADK
jgi:hypothetical protein